MIGEIESRLIIYLSETVEGKKHDKRIADEEEIEYPAGTVMEQDTGFQGYAPEAVVDQTAEAETVRRRVDARRKRSQAGVEPGAGGD